MVGSYELLSRNAQDEVVRSAGLMLEAALAIRGYTIKQVRPILETAPAEGFRQSPSATELSGQRLTPTGSALSWPARSRSATPPASPVTARRRPLPR